MTLQSFFFLGVVYFCFCKSFSTDEKNDSSWNGPVGWKADFRLNNLYSNGPSDEVSMGAT